MTDWKDWVPDQAIEELTLRRALADFEDPVKMASKLFQEALPLSVMGVTHLAIHSPNEAIRFNAQKYVIDRSMGTTSAPTARMEEKPAWEKIFEQISTETDRMANKDL